MCTELFIYCLISYLMPLRSVVILSFSLLILVICVFCLMSFQRLITFIDLLKSGFWFYWRSVCFTFFHSIDFWFYLSYIRLSSCFVFISFFFFWLLKVKVWGLFFFLIKAYISSYTLFIYLFIFGCVGSSLLCEGFL